MNESWHFVSINAYAIVEPPVTEQAFFRALSSVKGHERMTTVQLGHELARLLREITDNPEITVMVYGN